MSDLAATGCGNNDCGCGCGNNTGFFNGGDSCSLIWLILILSCFGNGGCGNNRAAAADSPMVPAVTGSF